MDYRPLKKLKVSVLASHQYILKPTLKPNKFVVIKLKTKLSRANMLPNTRKTLRSKVRIPLQGGASG